VTFEKTYAGVSVYGIYFGIDRSLPVLPQPESRDANMLLEGEEEGRRRLFNNCWIAR
jgi:hypothetical protein